MKNQLCLDSNDCATGTRLVNFLLLDDNAGCYAVHGMHDLHHYGKSLWIAPSHAIKIKKIIFLPQGNPLIVYA
jgi:hypothetical protein